MSQLQTVSSDVVRTSVNLIRKGTHAPRFINFIRQLCGENERPMPNNQNWLVYEIFKEAGKADVSDIIFPAQLQNGKWIIKVRKPEHEDTLIDVTIFTGCEEDLQKKSINDWPEEDKSENKARGVKKDKNAVKQRERYMYYCQSLKFLVGLCCGRNMLARKVIVESSLRLGLGLEFPILHEQVKNVGLPLSLREAMMQLIHAMYVDIEPFKYIKLPRMIRMMPGIMPGPDGHEGVSGSEESALVRSYDAASLESKNVQVLISTLLSQLKVAMETSREGTNRIRVGAAQREAEWASDESMDQVARKLQAAKSNEIAKKEAANNIMNVSYVKRMLKVWCKAWVWV